MLVRVSMLYTEEMRMLIGEEEECTQCENVNNWWL